MIGESLATWITANLRKPRLCDSREKAHKSLNPQRLRVPKGIHRPRNGVRK
jgi:hypothetical protein